MSLPTLTLHHLHISQSERIVFLLEELSVPYTLKLYTRAPVLAPDDLAALTPMKTAPVLTSTTARGVSFNLSESSAIAEYILTRYNPSHKLVLNPEDDNYHSYMFWLHFSNGSLQPALGRKMIMAKVDPTHSNPVSSFLDANLHKSLSVMDSRLAETKSWLAGDKFTAADVMNVWCVTNMRQWAPVDLRGYKNILQWLERIGQRDAYKRTMQKCEEGLDWKKGLTAEGPGPFPVAL